MATYHKIKNNIKDLRNAKKLTQTTLANILGVHQISIAKWESQEVQPKAERWADIAKALDSQENEIFFLVS